MHLEYGYGAGDKFACFFGAPVIVLGCIWIIVKTVVPIFTGTDVEDPVAVLLLVALASLGLYAALNLFRLAPSLGNTYVFEGDSITIKARDEQQKSFSVAAVQKIQFRRLSNQVQIHFYAEHENKIVLMKKGWPWQSREWLELLTFLFGGKFNIEKVWR